jgi:predicted methyltransferase
MFRNLRGFDVRALGRAAAVEEQGADMRIRSRWFVASFSQALWACGGSAPPPAEPNYSAPAGEVVAATPPPAPAPPPAPPSPTPEEQKKAAEQKLLEQDFVKLEADQQAELSRFSPEVRKASQALAAKSFPSTRAALTAALAGPHRRPSNAARDATRHPQEMLEFFGLKANQAVLEYGPGEGWYTELLAPLLAKSGKLYVTETDPNGPRDSRSTWLGLRTKYFLERLPEMYGKVEPVLVDPKKPQLALDGKLDCVLVFRGLHGMNNNKQLEPWLAEFHRALKPKGVLGIEQHRAAAGQSAEQTSKNGYLPEAFVIEKIEQAGFKLVARSEMNANPKDTKDYAEGVWSLPPTLREGDKDRERYLAIGESDRMTLKFEKVARPAGADATGKTR